MRHAARHPALAGFALFTALVALARVWTLDEPINNDTGQYLYVGETMLSGGTPYVDAANNKGPVTYLLFALITLVSGTHPVLVRASVLVFAGLAALALAGYVAHYAGRAAGVVAGVTLALIAGAPAMQGSEPNTEQFGIAPMVGAWYLATRDSALSAAGAGACAAAAILINPAFAVVVPFAGWELWRASPRERGQRLLAAGAGAAAVTVPIVLWLLAAGALDDFRDQVLAHAQRSSAPGNLSGGAYNDLRIRLQGVRYLSSVPAGGLWIAGLASCAIACRSRPLRAPAIAAALWIVVAWLRVKSATYEFPHHYYPALAGIAAGMALGLASLWKPHPRWAVGVALVLVVAALPSVGVPWRQAHGAGDPNPFGEAYPVASFIDATTAKSDRILVSGAWGQLYWLSGRRAATRFFDGYLHRNNPSFAAERRSDLLRHPPRAIVQMYAEVLDEEQLMLLNSGAYRVAYKVRGTRVFLRS